MSKIYWVLSWASIIINIVALILNIPGFGILIKTPANSSFTDIQKFHLVQLSILHVTLSALGIANMFVHMYIGPYTEAYMIIFNLQGISIFIWYVGIMTSLTIDRFLSVYLSIRYHLYCTLRKYQITSAITILASLISVVLCQIYDQTEILDFAVLILWPSIGSIFLVTCIVTYAYFFKKTRQVRRRIATMCTPAEPSLRSNNQTTSSIYSDGASTTDRSKKKRKSLIVKENLKAFFMPSLLTISYLLCYIIPDQVMFWLRIADIQISDNVLMLMFCLYNLGSVCDALVYIFFQKDVRKTAKKMFYCKTNNV